MYVAVSLVTDRDTHTQNDCHNPAVHAPKVKNAYIQVRKHIRVASHSIVCAALQSTQKGARCFIKLEN